MLQALPSSTNSLTEASPPSNVTVAPCAPAARAGGAISTCPPAGTETLSEVPPPVRTTVASSAFDEKLDKTSLAGAPAEQYQAVNDAASGATELAPAATGVVETVAAASPLKLSRAANVPPVNSATTTAKSRSLLLV